MKHVRLSEARKQIEELFDEVERGETLVISLEGKLSHQKNGQWPTITDEQRERARMAMRELRELRKGAGKVTVEEILAWRYEGRRF